MKNPETAKAEGASGSSRIIAYGFERLGFQLPDQPLKIPKIGTAEFVDFHTKSRLDEADGVIIPQGIFERFQRQDTSYSGVHTKISYERDLLLERKREVLNLIRSGRWVCFLVGEIIDEVPQGNETQAVKSTDLAKISLNQFGVRRDTVAGGLAFLESQRNEFSQYTKDYGAAKTIFYVDQDMRDKARELVKCGNSLVGFELLRLLFFLPFHTTRLDAETANDIVTTVARAVVDYRQKTVLHLPDWLEELQFQREIALTNEIASLEQTLNQKRTELAEWREYKAVLTTSGELLKQVVLTVFDKYFELKIDPIDEGREDAKILNEDAECVALLEIKGTKKGITRQHINQVDSHRERNKLTKSQPGVLLINNEMSVEGIDKRLSTTVPSEHIKHARLLNVVIVRTIDLLFLMRQLEDRNASDRKQELLELINSGGGWLCANSERYKLVLE